MRYNTHNLRVLLNREPVKLPIHCAYAILEYVAYKLDNENFNMDEILIHDGVELDTLLSDIYLLNAGYTTHKNYTQCVIDEYGKDTLKSKLGFDIRLSYDTAIIFEYAELKQKSPRRLIDEFYGDNSVGNLDWTSTIFALVCDYNNLDLPTLINLGFSEPDIYTIIDGLHTMAVPSKTLWGGRLQFMMDTLPDLFHFLDQSGVRYDFVK